MVIIVSGMAVGLLIDTLTDIILGVLTNTGVDIMVDVNVNVFVSVITAFEFATPDPCEEFRCSAAFDCRPMTALDIPSVLQA